VDIFKTYTEHFVSGLATSDGVQYSSVATVGTTAVEVFNRLIDAGVDMTLKELEVSLIPKFTELTGGTTTGSLFFYWRARQESVATTRNYIALCATTGQGIGSGASLSPTLSGYIPIDSIPQAPIRLSLTAQALYASAFEAKVTNNSYVRLVGIVIPGA
jgi:hypothetical protein